MQLDIASDACRGTGVMGTTRLPFTHYQTPINKTYLAPLRPADRRATNRAIAVEVPAGCLDARHIGQVEIRFERVRIVRRYVSLVLRVYWTARAYLGHAFSGGKP